MKAVMFELQFSEAKKLWFLINGKWFGLYSSFLPTLH